MKITVRQQQEPEKHLQLESFLIIYVAKQI